MRKSRSLLNNISGPQGTGMPGNMAAPPVPGIMPHAQQIQQHMDQFLQHPGAGYNTPAMPYGYPSAQFHAPNHQYAPQPAQGVDLSGLKMNLDRLAERLSDLGKAQATTRTDDKSLALIEKQMAVIANSVTELRAAFGKLQSDSVHPSQVVGLKSAIEQNYQDVVSRLDSMDQSGIDPNAYAKAVETSHANILDQVRKIGESIGSSNAPSNEILSDLEANYRSLEQRIEQLGSSLSGLDNGPHLQQLLAQVTGLQASLEKLESSPRESGSHDLSAVEMRLEEVTRAVSALSAVDRGTDNLERIEARVIELSRSLDGLMSQDAATKPENGQASSLDLSSLENYLSETNSALRDLESKIAGQSQDESPLLEQMSAEVRKLGDKVDNISAISGGTGSDGSDNNLLFERLNELVERVEEVKHSDTGEHSGEAQEKLLNSLQEQVAGISSQLENLSGSAPSLDAVTQSLSSIEQQLGASRDISIELAATAAEEALRRVIPEIPGNSSSAPPETFEALQQDIRGLHDVLHGSGDVHFEDLKQTLGGIAERLEGIETGIAELRPIETAGSQPQASHVEERETEPAAFAEMPGDTSSENDTDDQASDSRVSAEPEDSVAPQSNETVEEAPNPTGISEHEPENVTAVSAGEQLVKAARQAELERINTAKQQDEANGMVDNADDLSGSLAAHAHSLVEEQKSGLEQVHSPELSPEVLPEPDSDPSYSPMPESADHEDMALEPGAPGPDLEALVRQANERRKTLATRGEAVSGTDFLAAARQAAQAAAMEASAVEAENQKEIKAKSKSLLGNIPSLLSRKKKALIIAAAAALLVAVAVPIINNYALDGTGGSEQTIAALESDIKIEEPSAETANDSEPVSLVVEEVVEEELPEAIIPEDIETVQNVSPEHTASIPETAKVEPVNLGQIGFASQALRAAALDNDPAAFFEIGRRLTNGIGTEKNLAEAATWYERAANLGYVPAQYLIGNFNEKGIGIPADRTMAEAWYEQASESGHVVAMHNLAVLNASPDPETGKVDMSKAKKWFAKAAEHGLRDSQVNLGILLAKGDGIPVDLVESYKWFAIAAKSGDKDAANKRDFIADAMRPDQLEEARALVKNWKQIEPDAAANNVSIPDSWKNSEDKLAVLTDKQSIIKAQSMLTSLGFDAGTADGIIGQKTRNAIMAFRSKSGLAVNDKIDVEFMEALKAVSI